MASSLNARGLETYMGLEADFFGGNIWMDKLARREVSPVKWEMSM